MLVLQQHMPHKSAYTTSIRGDRTAAASQLRLERALV